MSLFQTIFTKLLIEDITAGSALTGGAPTAGSYGGKIGNVDSYASGDARIPSFLGSKKKQSKKKRRKKKKKLPKVPGEQFPVVHTRFSGMTGPSQKAGFGAF